MSPSTLILSLSLPISKGARQPLQNLLARCIGEPHLGYDLDSECPRPVGKQDGSPNGSVYAVK